MEGTLYAKCGASRTIKAIHADWHILSFVFNILNILYYDRYNEIDGFL
jgi:hypothetical protein